MVNGKNVEEPATHCQPQQLQVLQPSQGIYGPNIKRPNHWEVRMEMNLSQRGNQCPKKEHKITSTLTLSLMWVSLIHLQQYTRSNLSTTPDWQPVENITCQLKDHKSRQQLMFQNLMPRNVIHKFTISNPMSGRRRLRNVVIMTILKTGNYTDVNNHKGLCQFRVTVEHPHQMGLSAEMCHHLMSADDGMQATIMWATIVSIGYIAGQISALTTVKQSWVITWILFSIIVTSLLHLSSPPTSFPLEWAVTLPPLWNLSIHKMQGLPTPHRSSCLTSNSKGRISILSSDMAREC